MTQLASGLKTVVDNGRERRTDGLMKHLGLIDAGSLRASDNQNANAGAGLELLHDRPGQTSYIQSLQRDAPITWRDLVIQAKNVALNAVGGKVTLPAGTAQALLGQLRYSAYWASPNTTAWNETPVQVTATTTGGLCRIEGCGTLSHTLALAAVYIGFGMDGGLNFDSLTVCQIPSAGGAAGYSYVCYVQPSAGSHRFATWMYSPQATGGLNLNNSLYVTEQRC